MIIKMMACWRLAKKYSLPHMDVLLPTGCDCVIEGVLGTVGIKDEYGCAIELVHKDLQYILWMAVPVFGILPCVLRIVWRYKVLYKYVAPAIYPGMSDWLRLLYIILPSAFYLKVWIDLKENNKA